MTDDDSLSRRTLEGHIAHTPLLTPLGSFADGMQLLEFLRTAPRVDILFLDVQMPQLSGLDVIRLLPTAPAVVLTTARADFAVEAFALRVADYLVKPVQYPRFLQAVERVRMLQPPASRVVISAAPVEREPALFVKSIGRLTRVTHNDILYVEAVDDHAVIVTLEQQLPTTQALPEVLSRLPEPPFMRVHRSYVVNRRHIQTIEDSTLVLTAGRRVPIGRTYLNGVIASFPTL